MKTKTRGKVPRMIQVFPMTNNNETNQKAILWDSDGQQLMVDNGASASITPYLTNFIQHPQAIDSKVKGIGGHIQVTYKRTH